MFYFGVFVLYSSTIQTDYLYFYINTFLKKKKFNLKEMHFLYLYFMSFTLLHFNCCCLDRCFDLYTHCFLFSLFNQTCLTKHFIQCIFKQFSLCIEKMFQHDETRHLMFLFVFIYLYVTLEHKTSH